MRRLLIYKFERQLKKKQGNTLSEVIDEAKATVYPSVRPTKIFKKSEFAPKLGDAQSSHTDFSNPEAQPVGALVVFINLTCKSP